jgi:hypothetical protein
MENIVHHILQGGCEQLIDFLYSKNSDANVKSLLYESEIDNKPFGK